MSWVKTIKSNIFSYLIQQGTIERAVHYLCLSEIQES